MSIILNLNSIRPKKKFINSKTVTIFKHLQYFMYSFFYQLKNSDVKKYLFLGSG